MKKVVSYLLRAALIVCAIASASAETERRSIIEFCQLFQHRVDMLKYEHGYDCNVFFTPTSTVQYGTTKEISCAAGEAFVQQDSDAIDRFLTTLFDMDATEDKQQQQIMSAMMALSALEYSQLDDDITIAGEYMLGISQQKNAVEKALSIWTDIIGVKLNDDNVWESIFQGEKALVYEGNYDYYITYFEYEHDGKAYRYIHMTAESK